MISSWKHFLIKSGRFLCFWSVQVAPRGVELGPRRSQELKGSPELQNGGLRASEDAWMTISRLRHFSVKSGRFLCFGGVQVAQGVVEPGPRRSLELRGSPELQSGGLRKDVAKEVSQSSGWPGFGCIRFFWNSTFFPGHPKEEGFFDYLMHPKPGHPELCDTSLATHLGNFSSQASALGSL